LIENWLKAILQLFY